MPHGVAEILITHSQLRTNFFFVYFLSSGGGSPLYPELLQYNTMILQRIRIIVFDAGFEPEISAPEVWCATNEPSHLKLIVGVRCCYKQ